MRKKKKRKEKTKKKKEEEEEEESKGHNSQSPCKGGLPRLMLTGSFSRKYKFTNDITVDARPVRGYTTS